MPVQDQLASACEMLVAAVEDTWEYRDYLDFPVRLMQESIEFIAAKLEVWPELLLPSLLLLAVGVRLCGAACHQTHTRTLSLSLSCCLSHACVCMPADVGFFIGE